jgi:hypothetical protein
MKHLNINSYCAVNQGKQPVPANWLHTAVSFSSIRGTDINGMALEQEGWDD